MRTDIKERWLSALESGDYDQTTGRLAQVGKDGRVGYCCLGVLCDVVKDDLKLTFEAKDGHMFFDGDNSILPMSVMKYSGLDRRAPKYNFKYAEYGEVWDDQGKPIAPFDERGGEWIELHLPSLNDEGFTFAQIADIVRWAEG